MLILLITEPGNDIMSKKYGQHGKLGVDGVARSALGFPRGEAVERSETDEEQRNVSITNAVRKKGTVFKSVPSDLTARYAERYRRSSSTPFGGTFPPGESISPSNSNFHNYLPVEGPKGCKMTAQRP